ncbi:CBS domain-containing protein [Candidatus Saccharibacteria bacterium]|nr:CBS domain-containing protein [Candidatus Saccharibacteria bacterium]
MFENLLRKFVKFIDPKLEKYRQTKLPTPKYTPKNLAEFIDILKRTPKDILSSKDRSRIAAIMNFDHRKVKDLMVPKNQLVFVNYKEILGPLTLDKLYKSGFTNFPVVNNHHKVVGIIHTEALNALEIKKTDRAEKYMDKSVHYLHANDSLNFVIEEIERTNSYYFLVQDDQDTTIGCFTIQTLLDYLLN